MATFQDIFVEYYNLYRGDGSTPTTSDPEYTIALRNANNAINNWAGDPGVLWNELWSLNSLSTDGDKQITGSIVTTGGQTSFQANKQYAAPSDMKKPGGFILLTNPTSLATTQIQLYQPWEIQNLDPNTAAAFFVGDPNNGYTLNLQGTYLGDTSWENASIDYVYYKIPTQMTTGTDVPEMSNTEFMVNWMLAQRYRNSMQWPAYQTAMRDAQNALKEMEVTNTSGTNFNPWSLKDPNASHVGVGVFGR